MTPTLADVGGILPELIVACFACIVLLIEAFMSKSSKGDTFPVTALIGVAIAASLTIHSMWDDKTVMGGTFLVDPYSNFFKLLLYSASALTILLSINHLKQERINVGEYYAFLLFALCGMMVMVSAGDLLLVFLGLELTALSIYILAGFKRFQQKSMEAAAKYFVLGSFSSGILLFGISLLYGLAGTTNLAGIGQHLMSMGSGIDPAWILALILLVVGFGFKVSAVPFHMWAPDVYEGAPTPVTAFLSVASKAASFAIFLRVFTEAFGGIHEHWRILLIFLAVATIFFGNIVALLQTNIKRMLAYSSIAHAGYVLIGIVVGSHMGSFSLMLYLLIYVFMNMGAFGVVMQFRKSGVECDEIEDFAGLAKRNRLVAFIMLIFMFALAGIPPTAGFVGKFYVFMGAVQADLAWLAVLGVIGSAISAYFYLKVVMVMYMKEPDGNVTLTISRPAILALTVATVAVILLGVYPAPVIDFTNQAVLSISPPVIVVSP
jgi:NADH-quinone oxidoreductase subunit N